MFLSWYEVFGVCQFVQREAAGKRWHIMQRAEHQLTGSNNGGHCGPKEEEHKEERHSVSYSNYRVRAFWQVPISGTLLHLIYFVEGMWNQWEVQTQRDRRHQGRGRKEDGRDIRQKVMLLNRPGARNRRRRLTEKLQRLRSSLSSRLRWVICTVSCREITVAAASSQTEANISGGARWDY